VPFPPFARARQIIASNPNTQLLAATLPLLPASLKRLLSQRVGTSYTLFAPSDSALRGALKAAPGLLNAFPAADVAATVSRADVAPLVALLSYHLVQGAALRSGDLRNGQTLNTALNVPLQVSLPQSGGVVRLLGVGSEAVVTQPDLLACGAGVVHIIDTLLLPVRLSDGTMGTTAGAAGAAAAPSAAATTATLMPASSAAVPSAAASSANTVIIEKPPVYASGGAAGRRLAQAVAPVVTPVVPTTTSTAAAPAALAPAPGAACMTVEQARRRARAFCAHHIMCRGMCPCAAATATHPCALRSRMCFVCLRVLCACVLFSVFFADHRGEPAHDAAARRAAAAAGQPEAPAVAARGHVIHALRPLRRRHPVRKKT
jgi:uncharacterized surface protein with fasciclin (FAS1) repeats